MNDDPLSLRLTIPPDALVLDVGSGHKPHPRADVLCDKFLEDDTERGYQLVVDRPLVCGDVQNLPFRADAFDFIITRHILEHVDRPDAFFAEIQRVAPAGYIETPSVIWEHLHPVRTFHQWVLVCVDETIHMAPKPAGLEDAIVGVAVEEMAANSLEYGLLAKTYPDLFYMRHQWQRPLAYHLHPAPDTAPPWLRQPWTSDMSRRWVAQRTTGQQMLGLAQNLAATAVFTLLRPVNQRRIRRQLRQRQKRRPIQLASLMQCPACQSTTIHIQGQTAACAVCDWQTTVLLPGA
ncbi:MAG: class I SAM-dependent methyltransferase [Chloroflexi bacterium]|nr:class I SAM-dependent methyltransferase [Chloroflexota bacterium]MBP7042873.1 class I SAM-dependent methyltransferase [Chloroflexota bacterium]